MVNIISGNNASGKTVWLQRKYETYRPLDVLTNLVGSSMYVGVDYNAERLKILENLLSADSVTAEKGYSILVSNPLTKYTLGFLSIADLVCHDIDILLLDEPDFYMSLSDTLIFNNMLNFMSKTFKEIWVVSHDSYILGIPDCNIFSIVEPAPGEFDIKREYDGEDLFD